MNRALANLFSERDQFMNAEIEITEAAVSRILRFNTSTAPSLRVPVTATNRALLRWLRMEELSAWEAGRICSRGNFPPANPLTPENHNIKNRIYHNL
jgi:hypothetical protein